MCHNMAAASTTPVAAATDVKHTSITAGVATARSAHRERAAGFTQRGAGHAAFWDAGPRNVAAAPATSDLTNAGNATQPPDHPTTS